jgi:hypothetical protein
VRLIRALDPSASTGISAGRLPEERKQRLGEFASETFMRPSPQALTDRKEIG